ncbi:MAG: DUF3971 domain-containing protein, partial [Gammaproteobacteria bacterium]
MTPGDAHDPDRSLALPGRLPGSRTPPRTPFTRRPWLRSAILAGLALASFASIFLIAYELARARVPEHRAALERLVRAHTGLDVRFNELGFRWGWYGPEAVFRRVELGEPGRSNVLLRAPELIVGFDAWRTMQTGQLAAGRITLVAPDIDLERFARSRSAPAGEGTIPLQSAADATSSRARLLRRWRGGRIDLQGGTLRLPGLAGAPGPITLQIRRASLRHSDDEWNGFGLVFLPERLGRTARVIVQLQGNLNQPETLNGALRFDGTRVAFGGWRDVLSAAPTLARSLPTTGGGDVSLHFTLKNGRVDKADGQVKANDVSFDTPPWLDPAPHALASRSRLRLEYVSADWRFIRRGDGGQLQVEQLVLSREEKSSPLPRLSMEFSPGRLHGVLARAPLRSVGSLARWLAPQLVPEGIVLTGSAEDVDFDWNTARPLGERLAASARVSDASVAADSGRFQVSGLHSQLLASENRVVVELNSPHAALEWQGTSAQSLEAVKLASVLQINRSASGWTLETSRLSIDHDIGELVLRGSLTSDSSSAVPVLLASGSLAHANVLKLQTLFAGDLPRAFGDAAARLSGGEIEDARFELAGPLDAASAQAGIPVADSNYLFKGSLNLRDAQLAAEGPWPEVQALDAKVDWAGPRIHAVVDESQAGAFQFDTVDAQWDASGRSASRIAGHARARLEEALAWLRAHPELQEHAPHVQDLVARGDALFDFDVVVPAYIALAPRATPPQTRTRIAVVLEGVQFKLAPELPPVESLRGSLAFDSGRLQRSTLSAVWLGGPLTLKLSERRPSPVAGIQGGATMAVQVQGFIDAGKLVALSQVKELPQLSGQTPWTGEFLYTPPNESQPARWQGRADSSLIGIASDLPAPLAKLAQANVPLHVEISGSGDKSDIRANLADRVRTGFALKLRDGDEWRIERGSVQWLNGNREHLNATVRASQSSGDTQLRIESGSLGVLTGTLTASTPNIELQNLRLVKEALSGEGSVQCASALTRCTGKFELITGDTA